MNNPSRLSTLILWAIIIAGILPALYFNFARSINYDIAWLVIAAERLLRGGSMLTDAFETNPPLSLLVMAPPVLLSWLTKIPLYYCTTLYSTLVVAASALACHALLRRLDFLAPRDVDVLIAAYLLGMIVFPTIDYGERDHLVLAGMFPFVLWQICFTLGRPVPKKLSWAVLALGTLLILVKPHHGLLPTLMLIHRAVVQKRLFGIMRDPDFAALAYGVLLYISLIGIFFTDYTLQILPDVLSLYLPLREPGMIGQTLFYAGMIAVFAFVYMFMPAERRQHRFTLFLFAAALVALVPYYVQGKNYWYHLVPALALYYTALAMMAQSLLTPLMARAPTALRAAQPFIIVAALIAGAYAFMPLNTQFPTHAQLRALPLTQRIAQCPAPCSFFMFNNNIGIIHPTAIYADREHASRFPGLWFLPNLVNYKVNNADEGIVLGKLNQRYSEMLAADLARYKPKLLFIGRFVLNKDTGHPFRLGGHFGGYAEFSREWQNYEKKDSITVTNADYYRGTAMESAEPIIFDVYERKPDAPE
jgi:hypothetical protein